MALIDHGVGNNILLDDGQLLVNVHKIQERNDIQKVKSLQGREFSIEEAYDLGLVKRIEVASIQPDDNFADAYVKLLKTDNKNGIKAQLEIYKNSRSIPKKQKVWVRQGDDLYQLSGEHFTYRNGFVIQNIDTTPGYEQIEFNQGHFLVLGQAIGGAQQDVKKKTTNYTLPA